VPGVPKVLQTLGTLNYYCINGIAIGYLNLSPLAVLILAMMTMINFSNISKPINRKPTIIMHKGATSIVYSKIDRLKFKAAFPFSSIHADSSFLESQQISGPIIPPKGKK
jgi:hypothetical protein